ncbi:two-component response regulator ARR1 isoform X2 [Sesbania bispinosa]|nr:two-component response regulator ARR1 isoform X2 [Sesbania bispinosa]
MPVSSFPLRSTPGISSITTKGMFHEERHELVFVMEKNSAGQVSGDEDVVQAKCQAMKMLQKGKGDTVLCGVQCSDNIKQTDSTTPKEEDSFERALLYTPKQHGPLTSTSSLKVSPPKFKDFAKTEYDSYCSSSGENKLFVLASNLRGGLTTQENKSGSENLKDKKLSFTPTTKKRRTKDPKVEVSEKNTPKKRNAVETMTYNETTKMGKKRNDSKSDTKIRAFGKKKPKPLTAMQLTPQEERLSLYVFQVNGESRYTYFS